MREMCQTGKVSVILLAFILNAGCTSHYSSVHRRIKGAVDGIRMVDTHEHLMSEERRAKVTKDMFTLWSYFNHDLISCGMSKESLDYVMNPENPIEERWKRFYPFWDKTKNTAYAQCIINSVRGLYGIEEINEDTYRELNRKICDTKEEGWYKYVLKDKSLIEVSIVDPFSKLIHPFGQSTDIISKDLFQEVRRFDAFVNIRKENLAEVEKMVHFRITSLADLLEALDAAYQKAIAEEDIVAIKSCLAYERTLYFEDVSLSEADGIFDKMAQGKEDLTEAESKKLQDFLMHRVIELSVKYDLPVQIHTGLLAGNAAQVPIEYTNVKHLQNLFYKYKDARFVIFHGSYPYMAELAVMAKKFPNVFIDMCWMHIISPAASKQYLEEWLLTVPGNKIMAFGGDETFSVELVYGHALMARKNVTDVLTKMVLEGYYSEKEAIKLAERILRTNALELYGLGQNLK